MSGVGYIPPGAYPLAVDPEDPLLEAEGRVLRPPAPGSDSTGPALTELVVSVRQAVAALQALYSQARAEAMYRIQRGVAQGATDGTTGDALLQLFQVPQGCTGYLMLCALDEAGVTPAAPDTSGTLWHAIYGTAGPAANQADVVAVGQLFDFQLNAPTRGDAMLPDTYKYASKEGAPSLVGPGVFWAVIDAANTARQVAARYAVLVEQPEP